MNLIERYVSEIGKHLPRKNRADIETEIRSTLEDMLEERSAKTGRPVDDEMVQGLLKDYGAPAKVAASYSPEQYLIGPKLFPIFWLVLKIVGTVLIVLAIVGTGVKIGVEGLNGQEALALVGSHALQLFGGLISAFGNLVLVFAILERTLPKAEYENELAADWDPAELSQAPDPDEIRFWEPILAIVFTLLGLLVFNFYPQVLGIAWTSNTSTVFIPALSEAFFRMLPWINLTWLLGVGLNLWLLRNGRWTPVTRWLEIGLKLAGIAIAAVLLSGPSILALDAASFTKVAIEPAAAATLANLLQQMVTIALAIAIIVGLVEVIRGTLKLLIKTTPKPLAVK